VSIYSLGVFSQEKIDDQIFYADESDRAMNEAIVKAKSKLGEFFIVSENPPYGADGFKYKNDHGFDCES
jgi:uncharacterized protein YegJ (DUF2314 family)